jgi:hypothetical protein
MTADSLPKNAPPGFLVLAKPIRSTTGSKDTQASCLGNLG